MQLTLIIPNSGIGVFAQLPAQGDIVAKFQYAISSGNDQWIDTNASGAYEVEEAESIDIAPGKTIEFSAIGAGFSLTVNSGSSTCGFTGTTLSCTVGGSLFDFELSDGSTTYTYSGGEGSDGVTLYANEVGAPVGTLTGFTLPTDRVQSIEFGHEWSNYGIIVDGSKVSEDLTNPGKDVLGNDLTNPGTPQKNLRVTGYTGAWDGATYAQTTTNHESWYDFEIKFKVTNVVPITTLLGSDIAGYFSIRLPAGGTGVISIVRGGQAVIWSSDTGLVVADTDHIIRAYGNNSVLTVILDGVTLADSEAITGGFNTGYPIAIGTNLSSGQFWEGTIEYVKRRDFDDIIINHWICESSPTSLQNKIYDIGPSGNHATLTGATLGPGGFWTAEMEGSKLFADGFYGGDAGDGTELWDDDTATADAGWVYNGNNTWTAAIATSEDIYINNLTPVDSLAVFDLEVLAVTAGAIGGKNRGTVDVAQRLITVGRSTVKITDDSGFAHTGIEANGFVGTIKIHSVQEGIVGYIPAGANSEPLTNQPAEFFGDYCLFDAPLSVSFYDASVVAGIEDDLYLAGAAIGLSANAWILLVSNPLFFGACKNILVMYDAVQTGDTLDQIEDYLCLSEEETIPTYYVSNTGNDGNDGLSPGTAWLTLNKVNVSSFSPDDIIGFERGGTWNEHLLIPSSGTSGSPITFTDYGFGAIPTFDGTGVNLPTNHGLIRGDNKEYITVENLRVQHAGVDDGESNSGIGFFSGSDIVVQDCEVSHTEEAGIKFNQTDSVKVLRCDVTLTNVNGSSEQISIAGADGFEVAYCKSYTNGDQVSAQSGGAGIDAKQGSKNGTIHHNEVWDICNSSNGIYIDAFNLETYNIEVYSNYIHDTCSNGIMIGAESGGYLHDITVHHNIIETAERSGIAFHDQGTTGADVENIYIYNNTLYQNGSIAENWYGGVRIWDSKLVVGGITFKNNILTDAINYQIAVKNELNTNIVVLDTNVIYGVNADTGGYTAVEGANAITTDPLFADADNSDFSLDTGSPAIDSGLNSVWQGVPNISDYNGVAITDGAGNIVAPGGTVNCGAIE